MTIVLFEPHHDDAILFAAYTLLRTRCNVVTVLGESLVQGQPPHIRRQEGLQAAISLEVARWDVWDFDDVTPDWKTIQMEMRDYDIAVRPEEVWVPLPEDGAHEHHNCVAACAANAFGAGRVRYYATYRRGSARTDTQFEVVPEDGWPARKFQAMACYASQINLDSCRPWFLSWDREWIG